MNQNSKIEYLYLNDNKIGPRISKRIRRLKKLKGLQLQNNPIIQIPTVLGELQHLEEIGLDWFMYLHSEERAVGHKNVLDHQNKPKLLSNMTKVLKGGARSRSNSIKVSLKTANDS